MRMTFQRSSHFSFHRNTKCVCVCVVLTGSLVRAGLLTLRPNASSWNCSSWTTRPAKDLLEGESFWTYWEQTEIKKQQLNTHTRENDIHTHLELHNLSQTTKYHNANVNT